MGLLRLDPETSVHPGAASLSSAFTSWYPASSSLQDSLLQETQTWLPVLGVQWQGMRTRGGHFWVNPDTASSRWQGLLPSASPPFTGNPGRSDTDAIQPGALGPEGCIMLSVSLFQSGPCSVQKQIKDLHAQNLRGTAKILSGCYRPWWLRGDKKVEFILRVAPFTCSDSRTPRQVSQSVFLPNRTLTFSWYDLRWRNNSSGRMMICGVFCRIRTSTNEFSSHFLWPQLSLHICFQQNREVFNANQQCGNWIY